MKEPCIDDDNDHWNNSYNGDDGNLDEYGEKKLAKARKMRMLLGMLGLKKFGPGKLRDEQVWVQNILIDFLQNWTILRK